VAAWCTQGKEFADTLYSAREASLQWPNEKHMQRAVVQLAQQAAEAFGVPWPLALHPKGTPGSPRRACCPPWRPWGH